MKDDSRAWWWSGIRNLVWMALLAAAPLVMLVAMLLEGLAP